MRIAIAFTLGVAAFLAVAGAGADEQQKTDGASPAHTMQKALQKKGFKAPQMAGDACADPIRPKKGPLPFGPGETIYYLVTVKDIPVGKVVVKVDSIKDRDGRKVLRTSARGKTNSFFSKINKVKAQVESETDLATLLPLGFREDVSEKDLQRTSDYEFQRDRGKIRVRSKVPDRTIDDTVSAGKFAHDFLSAIHYVRALPLKKGQGLCFDVVYFKYIWRVTGTVIGKERVQTPAGYFNTIVIDGMAVRTDDRSRTRKVTFWLTDDEHRIPIKASSNLQMGETAVYASYVKKAGRKEGIGIAEEPGQEEGGE